MKMFVYRIVQLNTSTTEENNKRREQEQKRTRVVAGFISLLLTYKYREFYKLI